MTSSSWTLPSHFRQTRKGKILHIVSELYVRDDLGLGFTIPSQVSIKHNSLAINIQGSAHRINDREELISILVEPLFEQSNLDSVKWTKKKIRLVIVDTNVLLHNLDILEHRSFAISNIIIPQTALAECRNRNYAAYSRVLDLFRAASSNVEGKNRCVIFFPDRHCSQIRVSNNLVAPRNTPNDENDEFIRNVALFYGEEMYGSGVEVILLTDDSQCRDKAIQEQRTLMIECNHAYALEFETKGSDDGSLYYYPRSVRHHISELEKEDPNLSLSDLVAQFSSFNVGSQTDIQQSYVPHLALEDVSVGIKAGRYFQGVIRAERGRYDQCYVTMKQGDERVAISIIGYNDINRAIDGDIVVIEIHPLELWRVAGDIPGIETSRSDLKEGKVGIPSETAEPSICDEENVIDCVEVSVPSASMLKRPTGKVVGIIRRNFRQNYCGSIYAFEEVDGNVTHDGHKSERDLITSQFEKVHSDGSFTCVMFACDARIPPILFRTMRRDNLLGKRILVAIDSWPADSRFPLGHYVETLGDVGLKEVETEVLLYEHKIPCDPFPAKVMRGMFDSNIVTMSFDRRIDCLFAFLGPRLLTTRRLQN